MTQIINKLDDVSGGFIDIYKVLDNELQRSDIFIPFLNSMLKLQTCIFFSNKSADINNEAANIALCSLISVQQQVTAIADTNLVAPELTDPMIQNCEALRILMEEYITTS